MLTQTQMKDTTTKPVKKGLLTTNPSALGFSKVRLGVTN